MRAVDTNVLVRLFVRDDAKQTALAEARLKLETIWVSHVVLVEATWVLASVYDFDRAAIGETVKMLLDHQNVSLQEADVVAAALGTHEAGRGPGFADCLVLEIARKAGHLPLQTFDRALGALDGAERIR
jgi:predicted nucleic-acid-binding protein